MWGDAAALTEPWLVVIGLRLLLPLSILRWPLAGGLVAFLADTFDVVTLDLLHAESYAPYNPIDKWLDTYYLALEAWVCRSWANRPARVAALGLFAYRLVGAALYEITGLRAALFLFPNLFELFFLTYLLGHALAGDRVLTSVRAIVAVNVLLLVPKELQEYVLHVAQYPVYALIREHILAPLRLVS